MRKLMALAGIAGLAVALSGPVAGAQDADNKAFCKAALRVDKVARNAPFEEGEEPDPDAVAKFQKQVDKAVTKAENTAPSELADAVATVASGLREGAETGSDPFTDLGVMSAGRTINEYRYDSCGYEQIEVTATEYEFSGLPETVDAGTVAIKFTNEGAEIHELLVLRFKTDATFDELLELDEDDARNEVNDVGFAFAFQNQTGYAFVKLNRPGRYGAACFIPVGVRTDADFATADGPPHAAQGMTAEFTVEK
jgi:hypothetical protein